MLDGVIHPSTPTQSTNEKFTTDQTQSREYTKQMQGEAIPYFKLLMQKERRGGEGVEEELS